MTLGPHLGHGYVPGYGSAEVFESSHKDFFTVMTHDGTKHFVARERVQWRSRHKRADRAE